MPALHTDKDSSPRALSPNSDGSVTSRDDGDAGRAASQRSSDRDEEKPAGITWEAFRAGGN